MLALPSQYSRGYDKVSVFAGVNDGFVIGHVPILSLAVVDMKREATGNVLLHMYTLSMECKLYSTQFLHSLIATGL